MLWPTERSDQRAVDRVVDPRGSWCMRGAVRVGVTLQCHSCFNFHGTSAKTEEYCLVHVSSVQYNVLKHIRHSAENFICHIHGQHAALLFESREGERGRGGKMKDKVECNARRGDRR